METAIKAQIWISQNKWLIMVAVLLAFVLADCQEGGMYQGGGDSEPGWR